MLDFECWGGSCRSDATRVMVVCVWFFSRSVQEAVEFKMQTATLVMSTLQADTEACQRRTHASEQAHNALLTIRQQKMRDTKVRGSFQLNASPNNPNQNVERQYVCHEEQWLHTW